MNGFSDYMDEDRRLVILRLLARAPEYKLPHPLLQQALGGFGHSVSTVKLRADLAFLDDAGLISIAEIDDVAIAMMNERGLDVSQGRASVPGVKRPKPGA